MKHFRIWLLLLLAVLLPVRGAVAASMLCPPPGSHSEARLVVEHHADHAIAATHDHAQHAHGAAVDDGDDEAFGTPDDCNLCVAFCSVTPLASTPMSMPVPPDQASSRYPDLAAPAPSFLSGGQERPPRTI